MRKMEDDHFGTTNQKTKAEVEFDQLYIFYKLFIFQTPTIIHYICITMK